MALVRLTVEPSLIAPVVAEDHHADIVGLEIERQAARAVLELDHLARFDLVEAVDAGDAVTDREHPADLGHLGLGAEVGDLLLEDGGNLGGSDIHQRIPLIDNLEIVQFGLERRVDHARADPHDDRRRAATGRPRR